MTAHLIVAVCSSAAATYQQENSCRRIETLFNQLNQ